jgi:DNA-binding response OmpR family regulator
VTNLPRTRGHVLVVEDDETIRALLTETLIGEGWRVTAVGDAHQALDIVVRDRPAVVLLDLGIPRNGNAFAASCRNVVSAADIPIIVVSGQTDIPDELALIGVHEHVLKPFDLDVLLKTLNRVARRPEAPLADV